MIPPTFTQTPEESPLPSIEWPILLAGSGIAFLAGFVQGCTGFGMALIAAPALLFLYPPTFVTPTVILLSTINTAYVAFSARRHIRARIVAPLALGAVFGIPMGIWALHHTNEVWLKIVLGAFVVTFALTLLSGWRKPIARALPAMVPVGMLSGFCGGSSSMGGPPVILFLANQDTDRDVFRGNIVTYFLLINLYAIANFYFRGDISGDIVRQVAVFVPAVLMGSFTGVRTAPHVPNELFKNIAMAAAAIMGTVLLLTNLYRLARGA